LSTSTTAVPTNNRSYRMHITWKFVTIWNCDPVAAALMHRTAKYFITLTPKCFVLVVAAVSA